MICILPHTVHNARFPHRICEFEPHDRWDEGQIVISTLESSIRRSLAGAKDAVIDREESPVYFRETAALLSRALDTRSPPSVNFRPRQKPDRSLKTATKPTVVPGA
jgi:hypothetical protein